MTIRYSKNTKCTISWNTKIATLPTIAFLLVKYKKEDACECLMLLIEIKGKGFGPCPTNDNINSKGSFSELLFSYVLKQYTICHICTMKSPAFETTSLLYVTPTVFSCDQAALQMVFSVCLSHLFDYVPVIVSSWNFQELLPMTKVRTMQKVKVKGQGHRGQNPT